ncbi:MAG: hypothetical protein COC15_00430 [Legionellales bacterium]|nr:MAG: hypothetical protein COC15_00430 [Legionellales bacterium]
MTVQCLKTQTNPREITDLIAKFNNAKTSDARKVAIQDYKDIKMAVLFSKKRGNILTTFVSLVFAFMMASWLHHTFMEHAIVALVTSVAGMAVAGVLLAGLLGYWGRKVYRCWSIVHKHGGNTHSAGQTLLLILSKMKASKLFRILTPVFTIAMLCTFSHAITAASILAMTGIPAVLGIAFMVVRASVFAMSLYSRITTGKWTAIFNYSHIKGGFELEKCRYKTSKYKVQTVFAKLDSQPANNNENIMVAVSNANPVVLAS